MRWDNQRLDLRLGVGHGADAEPSGGELSLPMDLSAARANPGGGRAGLRLPDPVPIEAGTDDALAIEIHAKSIINRVPGGSSVPFSWTVNPYRGCAHACRYCFARQTHTYLDLDAGRDFDSKIVVKVNAGSLLRTELRDPRWAGEPIAMGTNTDPYQRAEGKYRLMPEILAALRDAANPFSVLTKGTLILRDLELYREAARVASVSVATSVGSLDEQVWRSVEPGTPAPQRRLDVVRRLSDSGIPCSVLMAPILPGLTDSEEQIDRTVREIVRAGAVSVTPIVLHLRTGAREWYHRWLSAERPDLLPRYEELYRAGAYPPKSYQREVIGRVRQAERRHGLERRPYFRAAEDVATERPTAPASRARQLSLL